MKDTVNCLLESSIITSNFEVQNVLDLHTLPAIEEASNIFTHSAQKVIVDMDRNNRYLIEFSNNLEKYMRDANISIDEAMVEVADCNNIDIDECTVVFDESCINKIDFDELVNTDHAFMLARC